jgi:competence protein ComEC
MPFGLDGLALAPMGVGVDGVIWVAETVAAWPGAVMPVPAMPAWGLILMAAGGLWLCLWRQKWRRFGILAIAFGAVSPWIGSPPHILVDRQGQTLAARGESGLYVRGSDDLVVETWLRRSGFIERLPWPRAGASRDGRLRCDGAGCIYRAEGLVVALPARAETLDTDCRGADVVIATFPIRQRCPHARVVIDRFDLWRHGAHALWLDAGTVSVARVNDGRGTRPWVLPRPRGGGGRGSQPLSSGGTGPPDGPES